MNPSTRTCPPGIAVLIDGADLILPSDTIARRFLTFFAVTSAKIIPPSTSRERSTNSLAMTSERRTSERYAHSSIIQNRNSSSSKIPTMTSATGIISPSISW